MPISCVCVCVSVFDDVICIPYLLIGNCVANYLKA